MDFLLLFDYLGVFVLMILIPLVATERASAKFVFTHFNTDNGDGVNNKLYIFVLGLLMSQYTLTGYDASAHMVSCNFHCFQTDSHPTVAIPNLSDEHKKSVRLNPKSSTRCILFAEVQNYGHFHSYIICFCMKLYLICKLDKYKAFPFHLALFSVSDISSMLGHIIGTGSLHFLQLLFVDRGNQEC